LNDFTEGKTILTWIYIERKSYSPEPASQFRSNLIQMVKGNSGLDKLRSQDFSKREIIAKIGLGHLIIFSRTTEP
jgi:hypothetical protein